MIPTIEVLQVQYFVSFVVGLLGELMQELSAALSSFGLSVTAYAADANTMAALTTGVFGTNSGLIYWINEKVFYLVDNMPWCDLGAGLGQIWTGLVNPPPCP